MLKLEINFDRGQHVDHFCIIILIFDQWFWRRFHLKILSRALAAPFTAEQNQLCNFGRRHHEEHFCEISNLVIQERMSFKD